jgi:hypothetical protein
MKHGIDDEAMRILDEAGGLFDPRFDGFRRTARVHESTADYQARQRLVPCPDLILWEELRDHWLAPEIDEVVAEYGRAKGLRWLRERIEKAEPRP